MPDLSTLYSGSRVFIDTNIFHLHYQGRSVSCTAFLTRLAAGDVVGYVNSEVLSDLIHKLMVSEAEVQNLIPQPRAALLKNYLQSDRGGIALIPAYQTQFENTMSMGIKMLRISKRLLIDTKHYRENYGLMTNDSLHIGNMLLHNPPVHDIITWDGDFGHVPGITVWEPTDVV